MSQRQPAVVCVVEAVLVQQETPQLAMLASCIVVLVERAKVLPHHRRQQ